jgi:hypothetical protein
LYPPSQVRALENDIHTQVKANRESDAKRHKHGRNVGLKCDKAQVKDLFMQNEIVRDEIDGESKNGIRSAASCIMIGLKGHERAEDWIENIQYSKDGFPYLVVYSAHESCEINGN